MMIYELYEKIAFILAQENATSLFDYIIHSMDDDGGFLRSRWCYWKETLPNQEVQSEIKTMLVTLRSPFDFATSTEYYEEVENDITSELLTVLKMQLFLYDLSDEEQLINTIEWSADRGFPFPIKIDVINGVYDILDINELRKCCSSCNKE